MNLRTSFQKDTTAKVLWLTRIEGRKCRESYIHFQVKLFVAVKTSCEDILRLNDGLDNKQKINQCFSPESIHTISEFL